MSLGSHLHTGLQFGDTSYTKSDYQRVSEEFAHTYNHTYAHTYNHTYNHCFQTVKCQW